MIKLNVSKWCFVICLICYVETYSYAGLSYFKPPFTSDFLSYQPSDYLSNRSLDDIFRKPLFYQDIFRSPLENVNFCDFLIYGDDIRIRSTVKQVFGSLPDHIPHLPISYREEDFPIQYWIHESVPETQRLLIDQVIEEINTELGFRAFTIAGIDFSETDPIDNRKDQKNVIYWLDAEAITIMALASNQTILQNPGITMMIPNLDILHPSSYQILDADILINTNFATDLKAFQNYLIIHLRHFGVEVFPLDADIISLYNLLIQYLENMSDEEYQRSHIDTLTQNKRTEMQYMNEVSNEISLTEEEERDFHQSLAQIDEAISRVASITPLRLSRAAKAFRERFIFTDVNRFQDSSSLFLKDAIKHELLHGLGLDHYTGVTIPFLNPLMRADMMDFFQGNYAIPQEVGLYAQRSLSCIYDLERLRQRLPL